LLLDVQNLGADFLACSAYKFFGPHLGLLWGRREHLERLPAYKVRPAPDDLPGRWMTGTPSFEGIAGTLAAIEYIAELGGGGANRRHAIIRSYAAIRSHENALAKQFLSGVSQLSGWRVWGVTAQDQMDMRVSTFGLTHRRRQPGELAAALGEEGLFVWNGHFYAIGLIESLGLVPEGMVRVGFLHYNTADEVDRLLNSLARFDG
jgi:selenocysteine lyase/cysteine desulfurase